MSVTIDLSRADVIRTLAFVERHPSAAELLEVFLRDGWGELEVAEILRVVSQRGALQTLREELAVRDRELMSALAQVPLHDDATPTP